GEVRLPARRPEVRRSAARWSGLRSGPSGDADDRRGVDPRSHRLPENPERGLCDDPGTGRGRQQGPARAAHSSARAAEDGVSPDRSLVRQAPCIWAWMKEFYCIEEEMESGYGRSFQM